MTPGGRGDTDDTGGTGVTPGATEVTLGGRDDTEMTPGGRSDTGDTWRDGCHG